MEISLQEKLRKYSLGRGMTFKWWGGLTLCHIQDWGKCGHRWAVEDPLRKKWMQVEKNLAFEEMLFSQTE